MYFKFLLLIIISIFTFSFQPDNNTENALGDLDPNFPDATPRLFAIGKVSTPLQDWGITMTGDGKEIYYTVSAIKGAGNSKTAIVGIFWNNGKWTDPEVVPFSGYFKDYSPNIAQDGSRIIFISRRPTTPSDTLFESNIWCVERINGTWGDPYPINILNTDDAEFFPTMAPSGDLYYCTNYLGRGKPIRIYHSKFLNGEYQKPNPITGKILTDYGEYCPYILPDEQHLIIEIVDGPNGLGGGDMYISKKQQDGSWGEPLHLGNEINSDGHDCYPILSADGKYLIYMSTRVPQFINDDNPFTFNELLWDVIIPNDEPFDFYWVSADFLKKFL